MMRLGIIGCGLIGTKRARAAGKLGIPMVAVYDTNHQQAEKLAAETGAIVAANVDAVLAADIDAVIIATTHDALAALSLKALEAGKQLLVEKPAGIALAELQNIEAVAKRCNIQVKVGYNHRFHPALLKASEIAGSGALGPLLYIRAHYGHGGRLGYEKEWRCNPALSGGGELIDQGSHLIDLSRWFLGDLNLASAYLPTYFWPMQVEDNAFLALTNPSGNMAWLHTSWSEWKNAFSFELFGRDGKLMINGLGGSYGQERLTFYRMLPQMGPPDIETFDYPGEDASWEKEIIHWLEAIRSHQPLLGNISDAVASMRIIEAAYQSRRPADTAALK